MANYVTTKILGLDSAKLRQALVNEKTQQVDFNKIIEMPKDLNIECSAFRYPLNISGVTDEEKELAIHFREKLKDFEKDIQDKTQNEFINLVCADKEMLSLITKVFKIEDYIVSMPDDIAKMTNASMARRKEHMQTCLKGIYNTIKYGYSDWYSWSIEHWGVKWNATDTMIDDETGVITFDTPWSTPIPILKELAKITPIRVMYADEDLGHNCGMFDMYLNKDTQEVETVDMQTDDKLLFAICTRSNVKLDDLSSILDNNDDLYNELVKVNDSLIASMSKDIFSQDIKDNDYNV